MNGQMHPIKFFSTLSLRKSRWLLHVGFWILIFVFYAFFFGRRANNYGVTFFFVFMLMPVTIGTTYFFNYYLIPKYLLRQAYVKFGLYAVYTVVTSLFLAMMITLLTFLLLADLNIHDMSPASIDVLFLLASLLLVVFLAIAIKLLLFWRESQVDYQRLMREKVEAELKLLKAQLNPHFLFNTLNNLYYLSSQKSDRAPQAVLQLSEILDYVLHSGKSAFVPLTDELRQVENYTALEMLRYEGRVLFQQHVAGNLIEHRIAPMMMITLIENAFKHGVMPFASGAWINLNIDADAAAVVITLRNSRKPGVTNEGIGLANLKSQLALVYPQRHQIKITTLADEFTIQLTLNQ